MSDFFLDLRSNRIRGLEEIGRKLQFVDGIRTVIVDDPAFGLVLTHSGNPALWAPYRAGDGSLVAIAGRPAFDEAEWEAASAHGGFGGLAAKVLFGQYRESGVAALERLNGNCV